MSVYVKHDTPPGKEELGRPARVQVASADPQRIGYVEGRHEYNIWYHQYLTDRESESFGRRNRDPALTKCDPFTDSGFTRADTEQQFMESPVFCVFFAKGCCHLGKECRYYHRVPTRVDNDQLGMMHDIFGRERFAQHRDDMDGVGSFNSDCRTLFIGDLQCDRTDNDFVSSLDSLLRRLFGIWGPIENLRIIPNKNIAFITYVYRAAAEFAKVAMSDQRISSFTASPPNNNSVGICVRWAHTMKDSRNEDNEREEFELAKTAVIKRMRQLGYSEHQIQYYESTAFSESSKSPISGTMYILDSEGRVIPINTDSSVVAPYKSDMEMVLQGGAMSLSNSVPPTDSSSIGPFSQDELNVMRQREEAQKGVRRLNEVMSRVNMYDSADDQSIFDVKL